MIICFYSGKICFCSEMICVSLGMICRRGPDEKKPTPLQHPNLANAPPYSPDTSRALYYGVCRGRKEGRIPGGRERSRGQFRGGREISPTDLLFAVWPVGARRRHSRAGPRLLSFCQGCFGVSSFCPGLLWLRSDRRPKPIVFRS